MNLTNGKRGSLALFWMKGLLLAALLYCGVFAAGLAFEAFVPWRRDLDPRREILWNPQGNGERCVLLGDSVSCSLFVESLDQTLWRRVQTLTGNRIAVFPGALSGAQMSDLREMATLVSWNWPKGTVVFLPMNPIRLMTRSEEGKLGNYYSHLLPYSDASWVTRVCHKAASKVFFVRNHEAVSQFLSFELARLKKSLGQPVFGPPGEQPPFSQSVVWNRSGGYAWRRFQDFERFFTGELSQDALADTAAIHETLQSRGMRLVVLLSPLNRELILAYAKKRSAQDYFSFLDSLHETLLALCRERGIETIDVYSLPSSDWFVDFMHTNAPGDLELARQMAAWLRDNGYV